MQTASISIERQKDGHKQKTRLACHPVGRPFGSLGRLAGKNRIGHWDVVKAAKVKSGPAKEEPAYTGQSG